MAAEEGEREVKRGKEGATEGGRRKVEWEVEREVDGREGAEKEHNQNEH